MNDMTTTTSLTQRSGVRPTTPLVGHGRYSSHVSYSDGVLTITVRHVEHRFLPLSIFGRLVMTKIIRLLPAGQGESTVVNGEDGLLTTHEIGGEAQGLTMILGPEWPIDVRETVRKQIDMAVHHQPSLKRAGGGRGLLIGALVILFLLVAIGRASAPAAPVDGERAAAADPAVLLAPTELESMTSAGVAQAAAAKEKHLPVLEALSQAQTVVLRPSSSGKTLIVWADPLCPNCRDFEQKVVPQLPKDVGVTIVPVAFKQGSRPLVSYAACGNDAAERARRWANLMSSSPSTDFSSQCAAGPQVADRNTTLFVRADLTSTPTIMASDGRIFTGDRTSAADVATWLAR